MKTGHRRIHTRGGFKGSLRLGGRGGETEFVKPGGDVKAVAFQGMNKLARYQAEGEGEDDKSSSVNWGG